MAFARFSSDFLMNNYTLVDNLFITELLPSLDADEIKIYIYGQYLCMNQSKDNSLEEMGKALSVAPSKIVDTFQFFEDNGLVKIKSKMPLEVEYLCLKNQNQLPKKYKTGKYQDFASHLQTLFPNRMLTPNEYNEFMGFLESSSMEQEALLMITQFCIDTKGETVRYPYILTIARDWASQGVKTVDDVEVKLNDFETQSETMRKILVALNRKGAADLEEKQMLVNWTTNLGFSTEAIIAAAKSSKSKTFKALDAKLNEFYKLSIFTEQEIKNYNKYRDELEDIALTVNSEIGTSYRDLEPVIETYIVPWCNKGFNKESLKKVAHYCFISGVRGLEGLNSIINNFYSKGIISSEAIDEFVSNQVQDGEKIKKIIETSGSMRNVTPADRTFYQTWTKDWGFTDDIILYAAELSLGKQYNMSYINQMLSKWKNANITTLEDAKKNNTSIAQNAVPAPQIKTREYTKEDLKGIFGSNSISDSDI